MQSTILGHVSCNEVVALIGGQEMTVGSSLKAASRSFPGLKGRLSQLLSDYHGCQSAK